MLRYEMPANRGTRVVRLLAILFVVSTVVSAPASARTRIRHYAGETSQGERIEIAVKVRDGVVRLSELEIEGSVACEDGTGFGFGAGIGFGGFGGPEIVDRQLEFEDVFFDVGIVMSGRLGPVRGSGTLTQRRDARCRRTGAGVLDRRPHLAGRACPEPRASIDRSGRAHGEGRRRPP